MSISKRSLQVEGYKSTPSSTLSTSKMKEFAPGIVSINNSEKAKCVDRFKKNNSVQFAYELPNKKLIVVIFKIEQIEQMQDPFSEIKNEVIRKLNESYSNSR